MKYNKYQDPEFIKALEREVEAIQRETANYRQSEVETRLKYLEQRKQLNLYDKMKIHTKESLDYWREFFAKK